MTTSTYRVRGMSCDHCVSAVRSEISRIAGVSSVEVDLRDELVSVTSEDALAESAVREAVETAGYELVEIADA